MTYFLLWKDKDVGGAPDDDDDDDDSLFGSGDESSSSSDDDLPALGGLRQYTAAMFLKK